MKQLVLSCAACVSLLAAPARAQVSVKPEAVIRAMAAEGKAKEDFVPKGWEVVSEAAGDLNADGLADVGLTIGLDEDMRGMLDNSESSCESPPYVVVVLFGKPGGGYRRAGANGKLYPPTCEDARPDLTIRNGVLVVNHNWRDGWAVDTTFRFRFDPAENRMMLIGFDREHYSRTSIYEGSKTSESYLTGLRIVYAKSYRRRSSSYSEVKREKIKPAKVAFENARMNDVDSDEMRPF